METLLERINTAKTDNKELQQLISDYMPFITKTVNDIGSMGMEFDDKISLAMICFMNCVKQYENQKGNFITFAAVCINNRIIDESRKFGRYAKKVIPLTFNDGDAQSEAIEDKVSISAYDKVRENENLADEIDILSAQLKEFGITFDSLVGVCPKQNRARKQCIQLGQYVVGNEKMREALLKNHRLAQSELARVFGLSEKTIEKHRKYIVTIAILLLGDYPMIRAFLPHEQEAGPGVKTLFETEK